MKYVHDISGKDIFAEIARKAIQDEYGKNIDETYLKKANLTFQYNDDDEIVGINNSAIAAGQGSVKLVGADGIYVQNDLTAKIIGISAQYATPQDVAAKQDKLTQDQLTDIDSVPFKLDRIEFENVSGTFATKDYVQEKIADIGSPLVIRGSKTCAEIESLTGMKVGDVYCVKDSGTIDGKQILARDEVAWTSDDEWIVVGREIAVDLSDYYKKSETSGADQLATAFTLQDLKFEDYYPMSSTSGKDQISEALASKVDYGDLTGYYLKTETSGKEELAEKFATKMDTTAMTAYVDSQTLATNYYDKTETSSKNEIQTALDGKVDTSELDWFYTKAETSGADQLSAEFDRIDTSATTWNNVSYVVQTNSASWGGGAGGDPEVNQLVHANSGLWNSVTDKLDTTAFSTVSGDFLTAHQDLSHYATLDDLDDKADVSALVDIDYKLSTIEEGAQVNVQSNWNETNTASDAYILNKPDIYTKSEVDTLLNGKVVVMEELPVTGESSKIYYIGPNSSVSGDDKYDEYLWYDNDWLHVGEHSIDLSDYTTYEYVDAVVDSKEDKLAFGYFNSTISSINGSAIKDTTYNAGANIDITNYTISGKDWTNDIASAVADKADNSDVEALSEEMAQGFADLDEKKLDTSSFAEVSGTFLTQEDLSDYATVEMLDDYYVKSATSGAQEIADAFDTKQNTISYGYDGDGKIISIDGSAVAGQGGASFTGDVQGALDQVYANSGTWTSAYDWVSANSGIGLITKSMIDEMWENITARN